MYWVSERFPDILGIVLGAAVLPGRRSNIRSNIVIQYSYELLWQNVRVDTGFVYLPFTAGVAQLVEPQIVTLVVAGSSPVARPKKTSASMDTCRGAVRLSGVSCTTLNGNIHISHPPTTCASPRSMASR